MLCDMLCDSSHIPLLIIWEIKEKEKSNWRKIDQNKIIKIKYKGSSILW